MYKFAALGALAFSLLASTSLAQVVITSRPVVTTYYAPAVAPAPVVSYYAPSVRVAAPAVAYRVPAVSTFPAPVTTYYAPAPVTSYYAPAPVTSYYAPAPVTSFYAPTTVYYGSAPVITPVIGSPVALGRSAYGTVRAYVPGQPVRNTLRFVTP